MPFPLPFRKNKHAQDPELEHSTDHSSPPASVIAVTEKEANVSNDRRASTPSNRAEAILEEVRKETADHEGEDLIEYPRAAKLAVITLALCLSVFCMALDNTIIATAIPRITDQFHSVGDVGWYGSAYLLTTCALQLFFGKLYAYYSIKWVYLMAFAIFEIGSAVCGAAPNSIALIIGRAVAGIGSAGIFTGAILIVAHTVPLKQRPVYTGLIGAMYGLASVAGPLLGGALTDSKATWRWCFYINLPIGAVTAIFIIVFFKSPDRKAQSSLTWREKVSSLDLYGLAAFIPAVICLLLALQWGGSMYAWNNWRIILLFVLFGVLIAVFIGVQVWRGEKATIPLRIMKQRTVWSGSFFAAALGAAFFTMLYYLPIWFQAVQGVSATQSGIRNLPMLLGLIITSLVAGGLVTTFGYYTPFVIASTVFMAIGAGLLSTLQVDTGSSKWIGYQIVFGIGIGLGMQQPLIAVQTVLPLSDVSVGTAIIMFFQVFAGALFVSVGQNVFSNKLISNIMEYAPGLDPSKAFSVGATDLARSIPPQYLAGIKQAYSASITQVFYVCVAMATISIVGSAFMEWKSVKGKKVEMTAA